PVARVPVAAAGAVGHGDALATRHRVTAVGRAGIAVVATPGRPREALPGAAGLHAVAGVAVGARRAVGARQVLAAAVGAHVDRARVGVVAVVAAVAGTAARDGRVAASAGRRAGVDG